MLIDAGCELDSYASDITRTFPIAARFSAVQRDVYELVLASQEAAIKAVKPGADFIDYHDAATRVLVQGLIDFKLCKGSVDAVLEDDSYKQFYMHRTGHWLGLDVHDAGDYMQKGKWRKLKPGMVLTVEPGLLHPPRAERSQGVLEHRRAHRGRRARDREGPRGPHGRVPEDGEGRRGSGSRPLTWPRSTSRSSAPARSARRGALLRAREGSRIEVFEARDGPVGRHAHAGALARKPRAARVECERLARGAATPIALDPHLPEGRARTHADRGGGAGRAALGYTVPFAALEARAGGAPAARRALPCATARRARRSRSSAKAAHAAIRVGARSRGAPAGARRWRRQCGADPGHRIPGEGLRASARSWPRCAPTGRTAAAPTSASRRAAPWRCCPVEDRYRARVDRDTRRRARLLAMDEAANSSNELQEQLRRSRRALHVDGRARASFPLKLRAVNTPVALRTAIIGNAAQALHPIAGQGLNLGLARCRGARGRDRFLAARSPGRRRDARRLSRCARSAMPRAASPSRTCWSSLFGDGRRLPTWGRGLALAALDLFPPARRAARRAHDPRSAFAVIAPRVLVAGGGPVGLAFACARARRPSARWSRPRRRPGPRTTSTCASSR